MAAIRIPIGMSDIVILIGSQKAANKATRRVLRSSATQDQRIKGNARGRILTDGKPATYSRQAKGVWGMTYDTPAYPAPYPLASWDQFHTSRERGELPSEQ